MVKGNKGKGNGGGEGAGKSVYLYNVDTDAGIATVARVPFDQQNERGETLVRTSEDVIRAVTDGILDKYPTEVRRALASLVKQSVRSQVRTAPEFEVTEIPLTLPDGKPGKPVKAGPDDEEDEDDDEEEVVEPAPVEPVTPTQTW